MLYKVRWGCGEFESYSETFRSIHDVRQSFEEEGQLTPDQIAELTVAGIVYEGESWIRMELVKEPPFYAESEQRVREVTLLWSAVFFLILAGIGAVAIIGAIWAVHP